VSRTRRLVLAVGLNVALVVLEAVVGVVARSLGLLSDAGHNLTDVAAVLTSLVAVRWARRSATPERSYGYHRGTILAALVNATTILAIAAFIVVEGVRRLDRPEPVHGGLVVAVALAAFLVNCGAALVLHEHGTSDLNMRSALLHMAGDAAASLAVAASGLVILITGRFWWLDPAASIAVALLIVATAFSIVRQAADVLLESTPRGMDLQALTRALCTVEGVETVHDLHVWSLSSEVRALSAHLVLDGHPTLEEAQAVGERAKRAIAVPFSISHSTLELECEPCGHETEAGCSIDAAILDPYPEPHGHSG
jgi:cobalt-zinc-cadmium efflux system protein